MRKFNCSNNISTHSGISDCSYDVNKYGDYRGLGINMKSGKLAHYDGLLSKINKRAADLQKEDMNSYDYGHFITRFSKY